MRTCRTERAYAYPDGQRVMRSEEEFSPDGDLFGRRHRNPDGSEWSIRCDYDERRKIRKKQQFSAGEDTDAVSLYEYDALGRLERVIEHSQGRQRVSESYKYRSDGARTHLLSSSIN